MVINETNLLRHRNRETGKPREDMGMRYKREVPKAEGLEESPHQGKSR